MADEFYEVHCTCCGEICTADTMAVDLDNICKNLFGKNDRNSRKFFLQRSKEFF